MFDPWELEDQIEAADTKAIKFRTGDVLKKTIVHIENTDQAKAFAYYLAKERNRHEDDIDKISLDLEKIKEKWGVEIPNPGPEIWVEV
uniref:Uncharacterized protein n=1 Tax=viral metagenome TaxID=1070528 RepID=A0A6M3JUM5_9ZZZZ